MSKVVDFLNAAQTYYLATVEEGEARVRPIGAAVAYDGKVYLATNNQKEMFKQIVKNPSISVSGMVGPEWIRITGKAVIDDNNEVREAMLEAFPNLKKIYSVGDGLFEVFYIDDMKATVCSFHGEPVTLED